MALVIGLAQLKGGTGRSTLATNLAGELARTNSVVLIDADQPQGTSAAWAALREQDSLTSESASSYRALIALVERLRRKDILILDGPPRMAEMTRAIISLSDVVLVPVSASLPELWATQDMLPLLKEAAKAKAARVVWTRYRGHLALAQVLSQEADTALGLRSFSARLGHRVAYVEALGSGRTAAELSDSLAREEVLTLASEVNTELHKHRSA